MKTYKLWNKVDLINGVEPSHFLTKQPFKNYDGDIILIYNDGGRVTNVESKEILASVYGIDKTLSLDEFMAKYFEAISKNNE